jgi:hypothetical protein
MPIPTGGNVIVTALRGMGAARVNLVRNGASVTVTVKFVAGLAYGGWTCKVEASATDAGKTITITPTVTTDANGLRTVALTFAPATFYAISGLDFDSRYVAYPRAFRLDAWMEQTITNGGLSTKYVDLFLGGSVTLTTLQPNYIHSVVQA